MKFKSDIEIQAGVEAGGSTGSNGQVLSSTVSSVAWIDQNAINAGNAEHVVVYAKNTHTASIAKGTPVYITGTVGATDTVQIAPADASDSAKMPAVGLLDETLAVNAFGYVITGGFMDNITTDPIDGATPSSNDTVYVKAGGGLTLTKPTGSTGLIQNVAKVGKVSGGNSGSLIVSSILRTNDVPNLTTGKIWVGDGNTVESTVVHLDEVNGRMGINNDIPSYPLDFPTNQSGAAIRIGDDNVSSYIMFSRPRGYVGFDSAGYAVLQGGPTKGVRLNVSSDTFGNGTALQISDNGNVGIGTTSPVDRLDLYDANDNVGIYFHTATSGTGGGNGLRVGQNNANAFVWNYEATPLSLATGGTARLTINATGGIRFNTGYGAGTLVTDASGNITVSSGGGAGGPYLPLSAGSSYPLTGDLYLGTFNKISGVTNDNLVIGVDINNLSGSSSFDIQMDGSTSAFYINNSRNVGIGTTSPAKKLHVKESTTATYAAYIENSIAGGDYLAMIGDTGDNVFEFDSGGTGGEAQMKMYSDGVLKNLLNANGSSYFTGNVGIGTTSPQGKLEVQGSAPFIYITDDTETESGIIFRDLQAAMGQAAAIKFSSGDNKLRFYNNDTTAQRMVIDASGNVGIGTDSPVAGLQVESTSTKLILSNTDFVANTTGSGLILNTGGQSGNTYSQIYAFQSGNTAYANLVIPGGNVGIGTTSPNAKLHVEGNVLIDAYNQGEDNGLFFREGFLTIDQPSITVWDMTNGGSSPDGLSINANDGIRFRENGGEVARFKDGNFGIGTTSPQHKLQVASPSSTSVALGASYLSTNNNNFFEVGILSNDGYLNLRNSGVQTTVHIDSDGNSFFNGGNVGIGTTSPTAGIHVNTSQQAARFVSSQATGLEVQGGGNSQPIAIFKDTAASEKVRISSTGNVGIGTTSPGAKVDIIHSGLSTMFRLSNTEANATTKYSAIVGRHYTNTEENVTGMLITSSSSSTGGTVSIGGGISTANAVNNVLFYTAANNTTLTGTERMRITSSGNVGIGDIPSFKLDVNVTSSRARFKAASGDANIELSSIAGHDWLIQSKSDSSLAIYDEDEASERMRITSAGDVGIGTTSPQSPLHIYKSLSGGVGGELRLDNNNSAVANKTQILFSDGAGASNSYDRAAITCETEASPYMGQLQFKTGVGAISTKLIILGNGNVGIGTTSPTTSYSKVLQINASGNGSTLRLTDAGSGSAVGSGLELLQYGVDSYIINRENGPMNFWTSNSQKMVILANGNVGIGTTSPGYKLDVTGTIYGNGGIIGSSDLLLKDTASAYSTELKMQNNTHTLGIDYENNETLRFITRSGTTTVPITFAMRTGNITCVSLTQTSDERKKTKIKDLSGDNIDVRWRSFEMKANEGEYRTGVIAQELEQNHPEFVNTDGEGLKSVKYIDLLIAKIAELETRIKQLENN